MKEKWSSSPFASSRDLENLAAGLDFLNTRDPEEPKNHNFPGSRILKNPNPQLALWKGFLNSGMTHGGCNVY
jgi:hypothetical protein